MDVVDSQLLTYCGKLFQEELDAPQRRVVRLIGVATPQLVVEDDRAPTTCKLLKGMKVVSRYPGTAMEYKERDLSRLWLGEVSNDAVPNAETSKGDETFTNRRSRLHMFLTFAFPWPPTRCHPVTPSAPDQGLITIVRGKG